MLKIRLARGGSKGNPCYRIVVADARARRDGKFVEKIGYYHPLKSKDDPTRCVLDAERVLHWLKNGAQPTDRVAIFINKMGIAKVATKYNSQAAESK